MKNPAIYRPPLTIGEAIWALTFLNYIMESQDVLQNVFKTCEFQGLIYNSKISNSALEPTDNLVKNINIDNKVSASYFP